MYFYKGINAFLEGESAFLKALYLLAFSFFSAASNITSVGAFRDCLWERGPQGRLVHVKTVLLFPRDTWWFR